MGLHRDARACERLLRGEHELPFGIGNGQVVKTLDRDIRAPAGLIIDPIEIDLGVGNRPTLRVDDPCHELVLWPYLRQCQWLQAHFDWPGGWIHFGNILGAKTGRRHCQSKHEGRIQGLDFEPSLSVGHGALAAIRIARWSERAAAHLRASAINEDRGARKRRGLLGEDLPRQIRPRDVSGTRGSLG